mmetsp:Transcript_73473/g.177270  ORF Transcript_73473/g.177270 Transcript_73473/m.177270 type:complete len:269 (-) Transcript_73473:1171-1977(-)
MEASSLFSRLLRLESNLAFLSWRPGAGSASVAVCAWRRRKADMPDDFVGKAYAAADSPASRASFRFWRSAACSTLALAAAFAASSSTAACALACASATTASAAASASASCNHSASASLATFASSASLAALASAAMATALASALCFRSASTFSAACFRSASTFAAALVSANFAVRTAASRTQAATSSAVAKPPPAGLAVAVVSAPTPGVASRFSLRSSAERAREISTSKSRSPAALACRRRKASMPAAFGACAGTSGCDPAPPCRAALV